MLGRGLTARSGYWHGAIIHSDPHNKGKTITAAALATNVNVMKLGILGILHTNGENKHQSITKRYIFELAIFFF